VTSPLLSTVSTRKLHRLRSLVRGYGSVLVAFSGGTDSSFLLAACIRALGRDKVVAVTAVSPAFPAAELVRARAIARSLGAVKHLVVRTRVFKNKLFTRNSPRRCYVCKKDLFSVMKDTARHYRMKVVIEASTVSDRTEFRPGRQALKELGIRSPLDEAGFTKAEVRRTSKAWGLNTWDTPSKACLVSRVPYGVPLTSGVMRRVHQSEEALASLGFAQVRVRHYGVLCRIEVEEKDLPRILKCRATIARRLKKAGYVYITLDLEGYRTGSMDYARYHSRVPQEKR
jgi:pyridinium-3,5-biscarboxylic acid mononucleotide sulfurtransferase